MKKFIGVIGLSVLHFIVLWVKIDWTTAVVGFYATLLVGVAWAILWRLLFFKD